MKIELNLVFSQNIFSRVFSLLSRQRADANDESDVLTLIKGFLQSNISVFQEVLSDEDLINRIQNIDELSVSEFYSLKYILAMSGIDVLVNEVAELEVDPEEIPEGSKEYIIIDELSDNGTFIRMGSKIVMNEDEENLYDVYERVINIYDFFGTPLTSGYRNPLKNQLDVLKQNEELIGVSPTQITTSIEATLSFLGKSIILLTNKQ